MAQQKRDETLDDNAPTCTDLRAPHCSLEVKEDGSAVGEPLAAAETQSTARGTKNLKRERGFFHLLHVLSEAESAEYNENMDERNKNQNAKNADGRSLVVSKIKRNTKTTLEVAIQVFLERQEGKGFPLPANDDRQKYHWNIFQKVTKTCLRKILYFDTNGKLHTSMSVDNMKRCGVSAVENAKRRLQKNAKNSVIMKGRDQPNALEGCGIQMFWELFKSVLMRDEVSQWNLQPCFDGIQADMMIHHTSWGTDKWKPIQFKVSQIHFGKKTGYNFKKEQYEPWMYCVAVGIRNYKTSINPTSVDDTRVPGVCIYELWDLGTCPVTFNPSPATPYVSICPSKRCFVMHDAKADGYAQPHEFIWTMINNLHAWPYTFSAHEILFSPELNKKSLQAPKKAVEMLGLFELAKVLPELRAPFRQNETVDSVWFHCCISNKTATMKRGVSKHRFFPLCSHKFDHFCHWVIASYGGSDNYKKVAVIPAAIVYRSGKKSFCWNEENPESMKHIKLFNLETQAEELRAYLQNAPEPPSHAQ